MADTKQILANLRTKYPQYSDIDDPTLLSLLKTKYPEYSDLELEMTQLPSQIGRKGAVGEFAKGMADYLIGGPVSLLQTLGIDPLERTLKEGLMGGPRSIADAAKRVIASHKSQIGSGLAQISSGDEKEGAFRVGMGSIPVAGLTALDIYDTAREGNIPQAAGKGAALLAPGAIKRGLSLGKTKISSFKTPAESTQIAELTKRGVPVDLAQATGDPFLEGAKALIERLPLAGQAAKRFRVGQTLAREQAALVLAQEQTPFTLAKSPKFTFGTKIDNFLERRSVGFSDKVTEAKKKMVEAAEKNPTVVPGEDLSISSTATFDQPFASKPTTKNIAGAVDYADVKRRAQEVLDEVAMRIPVSERQQMPGIAALENIVKVRDKYVSLSEALDDLSAVKQLSRTDVVKGRTKSQGKAASLVGTLHSAVEDTAKRLGVGDQFDTYNALTVLKHQAVGLQRKGRNKQLNLIEPAKNIDFYTAPQDANFYALDRLTKVAPQAQRMVAAGYIQDLMQSVASKGTISWKSAALKFDRLGLKTKDTLFGQNAESISNFLNGSAQLQQTANPSGSGIVVSLLGAGQLLLRHPLKGTAYILGAKEISRMLYKTGAAKALEEGMRLPLADPKAPIISKMLIGMAGLKEGAEEEDDIWRQITGGSF